MVTAIAVAVAAACGGPSRSREVRPSDASALVAGPYILLGDPGTAFVAFVADDLEDPPLVEWGTETGTSGGEVAVHADDVWYAALTGLPVGERVSYRVRTERGTGERHTFRAGHRTGEAFRFAIYGETQKGHRVHRAVMAAVEQERIDFVVHTGDMVHDSDESDQWIRFFEIERALLARTPIIAAAGDRDTGKLELFRRYFLHRVWNDNRLYFSRDWGDLRVIVVDGAADLTFGKPQYAAVEAALEQGARKGMLMVMVVHQPPYSSATRGWNDLREPIHSLAKTFGVELVVSGHALNYERIRPVDGVTYIVSGVAGARARAYKKKRFSAASSTQPHYVLVDVNVATDRLILRAVGVNGGVIDTHIINALAPDTAMAAEPGK